MNYDGVKDIQLMNNAVIDNTFDLSVVDKITHAYMNTSFDHLLETQKNLIGLNRFNLAPSDMYIENGTVYLTIDKEIVEQYVRKEYLKSELFDEWMSLNEMSENRDIFIKIPLVFINGCAFFSYEIKPMRDKTIISFSEKLLPKYDIKEITVMFIFNSGYNVITSNKHVISKYSNNLPINMFSKKFNRENKHLVFINEKNSIDGGIINTVTLSNDKIKLNTSIYTNNVIDKSRENDIVILDTKFLNIKDKIYTAKKKHDGKLSCELFVIEGHDNMPLPMPVPIENIVILKHDEIKDDYVVYNRAIAKLHYPNIYEILDDTMVIGDRYKVIYFHHNRMDKISYVNEISSFMWLIMQNNTNMPFEDILNKIYFDGPNSIKYGHLFEKYFNYEISSYQYDHGDFFSTDKPYHFDYKLKKMRELVNASPNMIRDYVIEHNSVGHNYFLYVKDIDLQSRLRYNNVMETSRTDGIISFDEPCYMFAFRNEGKSFLNLRFFIDGILYVPRYIYNHNGMEYIYIPTRLVTSRSYIEIERFEWYIFEKTLTFLRYGLSTTINIDIDNSNMMPTTQDLYFINMNTGKFIDRTNFDIGVFINKKLVNIPHDKFTNISEFVISTKNQSLFNIPIKILVTKRPEMIVHRQRKNAVATIELPEHISNDKSYIRVFVNNRLIPSDTWDISSRYYDQRPMLVTKYPLNNNDIVNVDVTPYQYRLVYHSLKIDPSGLVDLTFGIDKPFDISYFDIYLNGRKLNESNIINISTTKIQLVNIKSVNNLYIYSKDRNPEYFNIDYLSGKYLSCTDELLVDDIIDDIDKKALISHIVDINKEDSLDIYPNINSESNILTYDNLIPRYSVDMIAFFEQRYKQVNHINPDIKQFSYREVSIYPPIHDNMKADITSINVNNVIHMNPDIYPGSSTVIKISPSFISMDIEMLSFSRNVFSKLQHINPDVIQFSHKNIQLRYPIISNTISRQSEDVAGILTMNPNVNYSARRIQKINPSMDKL